MKINCTLTKQWLSRAINRAASVPSRRLSALSRQDYIKTEKMYSSGRINPPSLPPPPAFPHLLQLQDNYCPGGLFIVRDFHAAIDIQIALGLYPSNERDRARGTVITPLASERGRKRYTWRRQRSEENFITSATKELYPAACRIARVAGALAPGDIISFQREFDVGG